MPVESRSQTITTRDGGEMGAYVSVPEAGSGPGLVVLMEIFGVGPYVRRATERLAEIGYVALAPDLYRRVEPGAELDHDEAGLQEAFGLVQRLDQQGAVEDSCAALAALRELPEVSGHRSGVLGFCLGGGLAFYVAAAADPACAVCYYGSAIADSLELASQIHCPVLFHFGGDDPYIPREASEKVCEFATEHSGWECNIQPGAGHAFDNHEAPMFYVPEAADAAWELTKDFLGRTLGTRPPQSS
jgi:carboxymethylenebutenolidase